MRLLPLLFLFVLTSCSALGVAADRPGRGQIVVAGSDVLVPLENSMFAQPQTMPDLLADRARVAHVVVQSRGERAAMHDLCAVSQETPDIVLLTRSPEMSEIRRCELLGIAPSADLVAMYRGGLASAHDFDQVWIAFVPDRFATNAAAVRAVRVLRYEFSRLIEGTVYEPYFTARRN